MLKSNTFRTSFVKFGSIFLKSNKVNYWTGNENKLFAWKFNIDSLLNNLHNINEDFIIGKSIDIPALFLKGERSNYITVKDENLIKNHFSQAIIKKINHAGHWVHAENPDQFYLEVSSFINL